jgi:hypothetical protein
VYRFCCLVEFLSYDVARFTAEGKKVMEDDALKPLGFFEMLLTLLVELRAWGQTCNDKSSQALLLSQVCCHGKRIPV